MNNNLRLWYINSWLLNFKGEDFLLKGNNWSRVALVESRSKKQEL